MIQKFRNMHGVMNRKIASLRTLINLKNEHTLSGQYTDCVANVKSLYKKVPPAWNYNGDHSTFNYEMHFELNMIFQCTQDVFI